jgi:hypothetical protein
LSALVEFLCFQLPAPKVSGTEQILGDSRKPTAGKNKAQSLATSIFERQVQAARKSVIRPVSSDDSHEGLFSFCSLSRVRF